MPRTISPRITFHGLIPSPSLEAQIRAEVEGLTGSGNPIIRCRVSVELPHRHHRLGGLYRVVVEIDVRGTHVVVGSSADQEVMHANARLAVRDAFRAARRQLEDHRRRHGETIRDEGRGSFASPAPSPTDAQILRPPAASAPAIRWHRGCNVAKI
jgi:hypothetical protein